MKKGMKSGKRGRWKAARGKVSPETAAQPAPEQGGAGEPLLETLREMPAGMVYTVAEKRHVLAGLALCIARGVHGATWSRDRNSLTLEVGDMGFHEVTFGLEGGALRTVCDCGAWRPVGGCPHVVCALAVVKKALVPASLATLRIDDRYLAEVRQWLGTAQPVSAPGTKEPAPAPLPSVRLVIEKGGSGVSARVWRGERPLSLADRDLTVRIREFLRETGYYGGVETMVERFHRLFGDTYPIVFRRDREEIALTLDAPRRHKTLASFDLDGDRVTIAKTLEDGAPLSGESFATWRYIFDIPARRIGIIEETDGWQLWNTVSTAAAGISYEKGAEVERGDRTISLSRDAFNGLCLGFPDAGPSGYPPFARFTVGGKEAPPRLTEPRYRLNVSSGGRGVFRLVASGVADGSPFQLLNGPFWYFCGAERSQASVPLRTKKRSGAVIEACFASLGCGSRTELNRIIRAALSTGDFEKRSVRTEAKRIITDFADYCDSSVQLLLAGEGGWGLVPQDVGRQARLLELPFRIFGEEIFSGSEEPGEMAVDREELLAHLPELRARLTEAGFDLTFEERPVETVRWEVEVDATRSTIDWFELRPEVRCGGEAVSEDEVAEALKNGGLIRRGDSILLLDAETSRILSLLAPDRKKRKGAVTRIPRLRILDWLALRRSGVTVRLSPEDERIFSSLASFEEIPGRSLPPGLSAELRPYQRDGYHWLSFLYDHRFGACLADDMGLGKTVQAISLLAGLADGTVAPVVAEGRPHLVVVPPSLLFNWEAELARFAPGLCVVTYRGTGRTTAFGDADVVLTSYGIIQRDIEQLEKIPFHCIVLDEAQAVKNIQTGTTAACRRLKGAFTLCLTGTPVENHLGEYWSVMDLAVPGLLGTHEEFRREMGKGGDEFLAMLLRRTRPFLLRRTKDRIAAELPPKIETDIVLELTPKQKALYTRTVEEVRQTVAEAWRTKTAGQARIIALTAILKLRQICLSSRLLVPDAKETPPKVEFLLEQLEELFDEGHSVLVFSQFTSFLDIVEPYLARKGLRHLRLDGSTPVTERKKLVHAFQHSEEPSAFLLSLKAGGRGLNLTRATYVFHLDPWWNPAVEDQASDRAHRIGQTRQVTITRLIMRHTIEEKMMELKKRKLALYKAILGEAAGEGGGIGREDFEFLLG